MNLTTIFLKFAFLLTLALLDHAALTSADFDEEDIVSVTSEEIIKPLDDEILYVTPQAAGPVYFAEHFDNRAIFKKRWIKSESKKDGADEDLAKYDGAWDIEEPLKDGLKGDLGLVLKSKAKHSAISASLDKPFVFDKSSLVVQYEVALQNGQECGGAYLKLLSQSPNLNLKVFNDKTPYTIMFGPDKCGNDYKLHFIFRHKNPLTKAFEEKHCKKPKESIDEYLKDKNPHLYTLVLRPDGRFEIAVDHKIVNEGSLLEDFDPPVNPPSEIVDPNDKKPMDWDEREKIPDANAAKPEDWNEDEPRKIVDPDAVKPSGWLEDQKEMINDETAKKPEDWDDEMDGIWEPPLVQNPLCDKAPGCGPWTAPMIDNPNYRGKWRPPMITNPNYRGKWKPRNIPNPDYFQDNEPFKMTPIGAIGFELWSMSEGILFDNIIITDDKRVADLWAADTFDLKKRKLEKESETVVGRIIRYSNKHPWLWAVYILVLGIPIALILAFCCVQSPAQKRLAERKKKDLETTEKEKKRPKGKLEGLTPANSMKAQHDEVIDNSIEEESEGEAEGEGEEEPLLVAPAEEAEEKGASRDVSEDEKAESADMDQSASGNNSNQPPDVPRRRKARKD